VPSDDDFRIKHLDNIQAVITRLAQSSFTIRGWSVTLVSVFFAILVSASRAGGIVFTALVPTVIFWCLDAYYLRQERLFRQLHAAAARRLVAGESSDVPNVVPFDMSTDPYRTLVPTLPRTLIAPNVLAIPAVLVMLIVGYGIAAP
jgi:hypothetical protein